MSNVAERVSAGIALLDEKAPGWRDKINLATLNIRNTRECILGQVFKTGEDSWQSGYDAGCEILGLEGCSCCSGTAELAPVTYGFDADFSEDVDVEFDELQTEWERQLSA
jgi:hypothetical protein